MAATPAQSGKGIGAAILRNEDRRLLSGRSPYIADINQPGMWEVAFLRSPLAHANIVSVQKPAGFENRVFLLNDLGDILPIRAESSAKGFRRSDYPALADTKVRFVGEPIAICLGRTRAEAEDLASAVLVEFEELRPVSDLSQCRDPEFPPIHSGWSDNLFLETQIDVGDVAAARAAAFVTLTRQYRMNRQAIVSLEGRGVVTYLDERTGELVVYSSTQFPHVIRTALANCLKMKERELRVVAPEFQSNQLTASLKAIRQALRLNKHNSNYWNTLGVVVRNLPNSNRFTQHAFLKSIDISRSTTEVPWTNLGALALSSRSRNAEKIAHHCFATAQAQEPAFVNAWLEQGLLDKQQSETK